jgi:hypothetical protein
LSARSRRIAAAVTSVIGPEECAIYLALALLGTGCWWIAKPAGLIVPAVVMLWMYVPTRARFVETKPQKKDRGAD